tara:strand:+ start:398 stop:1087 length:690 start_codon:yes stop_codon:yes gene_type:complete
MTFLALIPARGGSKRIANKNIKSFAGKPIIGWTIEKAFKTKLFKSVIVSTDDKKIAEISKNFGAEIAFPRPASISDDQSTVVEVVKHCIEELEKSGAYYDYVVLLYATAPLMDENDIIKATEDLGEQEFRVSVNEYSYPIQRALRLERNEIKMFEPLNFKKRSQDLEPFYHDAAQFIIGSSHMWKTKTPFVDGVTRPFIVPKYRVQDIDNEDDWYEAELKFCYLNKEMK